jgi:hypothetical protein
VVLGYWGPAQPSGPKNMDNWWAMWDTVVKKYGEDPNAYFEIFNEPHMYTKEELRIFMPHGLQDTLMFLVITSFLMEVAWHRMCLI